jgi:hypothetical protein
MTVHRPSQISMNKYRNLSTLHLRATLRPGAGRHLDQRQDQAAGRGAALHDAAD